MELLEILDHNLRAVPSTYAANIPEFKAIIDRDESKEKSMATKELAYIYHMVDFQSPYFIQGEDIRHKKVKDDLFRDTKWEPDELVEEAKNKYRELTRTIYTELLESAGSAIRKLKDHFDEVDLTEVDEKGKPRWSAKDLIANIAKLGELITSYQKLKEIVEKEQATNSRNRRNINTNVFSE